MRMQRPIILIVEDDLNDQFLLKTAFKHIGVRDPIYTVNDGAEAIAYLKGTGEYGNRDQFMFPTVLLVESLSARSSWTFAE